MNPYNIRHPQDRRKVYNEYLANLQMQIDNLAKTEKAVATLQTTGAPPVQPMDTRTLSEKLLDVDKQKKVLSQALLEITDGAEASKIMNEISDEDVVFLGIAFGDFSKMVKQKFADGILAPIFKELLQRYKRDYINSISVQRGISAAYTAEELLLSIRELLRLAPNAAQLRDLRFTIGNIPEGVVPPRMRQAALDATDELGDLIPSDSMVASIDRLNPIDRASVERALNDGLSSITSGAALQELIGRLQQANSKQVPGILTDIINKTILTRDDEIQLEQAKAIANQEKAAYEETESELKTTRGQKKSKVIAQIKRPTQLAETFEELPDVSAANPVVNNPFIRKVTKAEKGVKEMAALRYSILEQLRAPEGAVGELGISAVAPPVQAAKATQLDLDTEFIENPSTTDAEISKRLTIPRLRDFLYQRSGQPKAQINKLKKGELVLLTLFFRPPTASRALEASTSIFDETPYDENMNTATFQKLDYADKRSVLEDADKRGISVFLDPQIYAEYKKVLARNDPREENEMVELYRSLRDSLGRTGEGMKSKKGKRIAFGCGLARAMKPTMMVKPDNIDALAGIKKEPSYIPIGKYVVNKHKLRDNMLLMRTVKGGQIAELPQMSISPKLGKMLNNIISGRGFPSHDELSGLEDSDKDIMYKVFRMSKAEGIESIPRPNKNKDEAEFNRFTILKGQILAGNNSKEMIKEFKTLLVKLIHGGKILRKEGHDLLIDLAALGY